METKTIITVDQEEVTYYRKTKQYDITINGKEVIVEKWWYEDNINSNYDCDYKIIEGNKDITEDEMGEYITEDEMVELHDFINELK